MNQHVRSTGWFDTIIVGAGSIGMAAGYFLAKAGQRVLLIDAGDPPHADGSHHGDSRLIRHAYGEGAAYVPLALRAQQLWFELEQATNTQVFVPTGVVNIGRDRDPFMREVEASASKYNLPLEKLSRAEITRRWPAWQLDSDHYGYFEPTAGVLLCERAVRTYRTLATSHGARVQPNTAITGIEPLADGCVATTTEGERFYGRRAIVCAGKWSAALLARWDVTLPVRRLRKVFAWFEPDSHLFSPEAFPGFTISSEMGQFYGFPDLDGGGLKVGRHDGGQQVAANDALAPFGHDPHDAADIERFLRAHLPTAGALRVGKTCHYLMTPDEHFIIDRLPGFEHVQIATGFSGHGFKFSSSIGEALAQRVISDASERDLSMFSLRRFQ